MTRPNVTRIKVALTSALLVVGLMANPARANHYNYSIAPLATFVMLDLLLRDRHRHHDGYFKRSRGHKHRIHRYGHSYSRDGYSYRSNRIYSKRKYKH
jgi:hypothetical protein